MKICSYYYRRRNDLESSTADRECEVKIHEVKSHQILHKWDKIITFLKFLKEKPSRSSNVNIEIQKVVQTLNVKSLFAKCRIFLLFCQRHEYLLFMLYAVYPFLQNTAGEAWRTWKLELSALFTAKCKMDTFCCFAGFHKGQSLKHFRLYGKKTNSSSAVKRQEWKQFATFCDKLVPLLYFFGNR